MNMDKYKVLIYEAIGEASLACCMCPEKAIEGAFDTHKAIEVAEDLCEKIKPFLDNPKQLFVANTLFCCINAMYQAGACWEKSKHLTMPHDTKAAYRIAKRLCNDLFDSVAEETDKDWFKEAF